MPQGYSCNGGEDQIHQLTRRRGLALVQRMDLIKPFQKTM